MNNLLWFPAGLVHWNLPNLWFGEAFRKRRRIVRPKRCFLPCWFLRFSLDLHERYNIYCPGAVKRNWFQKYNILAITATYCSSNTNMNIYGNYNLCMTADQPVGYTVLELQKYSVKTNMANIGLRLVYI